MAQTVSVRTPDASLLGGKSTVLFYEFRMKGIFIKSLRCLVKSLYRMCICGVMQHISDQVSVDQVCSEFLLVSSEGCTIAQRWEDIPGTTPENHRLPIGCFVYREGLEDLNMEAVTITYKRCVIGR